MTEAEILEAAAPPCHTCEHPITRVEMRWHVDGDGTWRPGPYYLICKNGHAVLVEALF